MLADRSKAVVLVLALCLAPAVAGAQETGSAQQGHALARAVCAECHAVEDDDGFSPAFPAPTFRKIADTPGMTATALSVALRSEHREMPAFILNSDELADVTAYILSLKR
jgi:mono/diheme cytochrome c family protein